MLPKLAKKARKLGEKGTLNSQDVAAIEDGVNAFRTYLAGLLSE